MKLLLWLLPLLLAARLYSADPEGVEKLDGTKVLGTVEITDDYTIRVSSDTGILNIPIAQLSEKDFEKYGLAMDRSKDGKLWHDRKEALETEKQQGKTGNSIEIPLGKIAAFQPLIEAYEKTLEKEKNNSGKDRPPKESSGNKFFTAGKLGNNLPSPQEVVAPFTSGLGQPSATPTLTPSGLMDAAAGAAPAAP